MNKTLLSLIVSVVGLAVFHYGLLPIFSPKKAGWVLNPYVYYLLFTFYLIVVNVGMRLKPPMALRAFYVFMMGHYFYAFWFDFSGQRLQKLSILGGGQHA